MSPANSLRIMQQQLTLLARSLGNIFIPILLQVIPYVIAFSQVLRAVADQIANFLGFKLPVIDYSNLNSANGALGGVEDSANSATEAAEALKGSLAGFDELNVITQSKPDKGTGAGAGGSLGLDLQDYDALLGLNKQANDLKKQMTDWLGITDALETGNWNILDIWNKMNPVAKAVAGILAGIAAFKLVSWGAGFLNNFKTLATFLGGVFSPVIKIAGGLIADLIFPFQALAGGAATTGEAFALFGSTILNKIILPIAAVTFAIKGVQDVMKAWGSEVQNTSDKFLGLTKTQRDAGKATAEFALAGAALGTIILPGVGTAIGAVIGSLAGAAANFIGFKVALNSVAEKNVFGDLKFSADELKVVTDGLTASLKQQNDVFTKNKAKLDELSGTAEDSSQSFQTMFEKIALGSEKLTKNDFANISTSLDKMVTDGIAKITGLTDITMQTLSDEFKKSTVMSEEAEKAMIKTVIDGGNVRATEVQRNKEIIYNINKKASDENRKLTSDEYNVVLESTQKINDLTDSKANERLASWESINAKLNSVSKEGYSQLNTTINDALTQGTTLIDSNYTYRYQAALTAAENAKLVAANQGKSIVEQDQIYNQTILDNKKVIDGLRVDEEYALNKQIEEARIKFSQKLIDDWKILDSKNASQLTASEKIQKAMLEKQLSDMGLAGNTLSDIAYGNGTNAGYSQSLGWSRNNGLASVWAPAIIGAYDVGKNAAESLSRGWNNSILLKLPSFQYDSSKSLSQQTLMQPSARWTNLTPYATGGFPTMGEMFLAREKGPELVGRIGNQSAVVNNNQIISGVAQGVAEAVSAVLGGGNDGQPLIINIAGETAYKGYTKSVKTNNNQFGYNTVEV